MAAGEQSGDEGGGKGRGRRRRYEWEWRQRGKANGRIEGEGVEERSWNLELRLLLPKRTTTDETGTNGCRGMQI